MITVLSTKKVTKLQKSVFNKHAIQFIEKQFIKTKAIDFKAVDLNEIVIFTSKNAVKSVLKNSVAHRLDEKEIICVGQKTKQLLEKNNFKVAYFAHYATDLTLIIKEKYEAKSFTFFSGNLRRNTLPDFLNANKLKWNETVVYETALNPIKIKEEVNGILFFSPSAIESYLQKNEITTQICFCIGTTTANALENKTKNIQIANIPLVENVIELAIQYQF